MRHRATGTVTGVNVGVTVPAGSFTTVKVTHTDIDFPGYIETYTDIATGHWVLSLVYDGDGVLVSKTEVTSIV